MDKEDKIVTIEQLVNLDEYMDNHCTVLKLSYRFEILQNRKK